MVQSLSLQPKTTEALSVIHLNSMDWNWHITTSEKFTVNMTFQNVSNFK